MQNKYKINYDHFEEVGVIEKEEGEKAGRMKEDNRMSIIYDQTHTYVNRRLYVRLNCKKIKMDIGQFLKK